MNVPCQKCGVDCQILNQFVYEVVMNNPNFVCSKCVGNNSKPKEVGLIKNDTITLMDTQRPNFNPLTKGYSRLCPSCNNIINHIGKRADRACTAAIKNGSLCKVCYNRKRSTLLRFQSETSERLSYDEQKESYTRQCPKCNKTLYYRGTFAYGNCNEAIRSNRVCRDCRPAAGWGAMWTNRRKNAFAKARMGVNNPNHLSKK